MFSVKLKQLRKERGLLQKDISQIFNVSMGAVGNWESGNRIPDSETLSRIADYFQVSVDYLLGRDTPAESADTVPGLIAVRKKKIPVLGEIACGKPIFADEDREVYVSVSEDIVCDYALIAKGDSTNPMTYPMIKQGLCTALFYFPLTVIYRFSIDASTARTISAVRLIPASPAALSSLARNPAGRASVTRS